MYSRSPGLLGWSLVPFLTPLEVSGPSRVRCDLCCVGSTDQDSSSPGKEKLSPLEQYEQKVSGASGSQDNKGLDPRWKEGSGSLLGTWTQCTLGNLWAVGP